MLTTALDPVLVRSVQDELAKKKLAAIRSDMPVDTAVYHYLVDLLCSQYMKIHELEKRVDQLEKARCASKTAGYPV